MPTESISSDLEDPLNTYSYLSLFPRTCRSLGLIINPSDSSDLDSVHNVLNTLALKETTRHIDQAKMILESNSEDCSNTDVQKDAEAVGILNEQNGRKRRPGLGRLPAKFDINRRVRYESAKFDINRRVSQVAVVKEPELDISKLGDPVEFFLAHERLENAKKELRRQSGILSDMEVNLNVMSLAPRPRRPGIPGRSKATYKHRYPSAVLDDEALTESSAAEPEKGLTRSSILLTLESLESLKQQTDQSSLKESEADDSIKDGVLDGSMSEVNGLLGQILSGTYDHLNSEGQLTLLQEQLQIKPISIDSLSFPKFSDIPTYDFMISGKISKPRKSTQGAFTGMNTKTPVKATQSPSSGCFSASTTPPKSPFANLSALNKHIMQLNRLKDSLSDFNTDPYSVGCSSPVHCADKQLGPADVPTDYMPPLKVHADDENIAAVSCESLHHELLQDSGGFPGQLDNILTVVAGASSIPSNKSTSAVVGDDCLILTEPHNIAEHYNGSQHIELSEIQMQSGNAMDVLNASEPDLSAARGTSAQELESRSAEVQAEHVSMEMKSTQPESSIDNMCSRGVMFRGKQSLLPDIAPVPERETSIIHKRKGKSGLVQEQDCTEERKNKRRKSSVSRTRNQLATRAKESFDDRSCFSSTELHDNQSEILINHPEQHEEHLDGNVPGTSSNNKSCEENVSCQKQIKRVNEPMQPKKNIKRKKPSLRKSIAAGGTYFESGVRRSKRYRTRPLEFWRGERYLYGRLEPDSTLPALIGVKKYDTPAKNDGKAILKVVDHVDGNKYRELIDLAALH